MAAVRLSLALVLVLCIAPVSSAAPPSAEDLIERMIEERKLRRAAHDVFHELQKKAKVENYYNDPSRRGTGIVAMLNGRKITLGQLAEACLERHGKEVLEGSINRKLIEQACKKAKITVTDADLQEEIRRAASVSVLQTSHQPLVEPVAFAPQVNFKLLRALLGEDSAHARSTGREMTRDAFAAFDNYGAPRFKTD